jgi:hypothetical protein
VHVVGFITRIAVIFFRFLSNLNVLDRFSTNPQISNLMWPRPVGSKLFHSQRQTVDWQTDRHDKTNSSFRNFANGPENCMFKELFKMNKFFHSLADFMQYCPHYFHISHPTYMLYLYWLLALPESQAMKKFFKSSSVFSGTRNVRPAVFHAN